LPYAHTAFFTNQSSEALAEFLVSKAPDNIEHVYFVSGGSEAMESALKLARQYFVEKGEHSRKKFIARKQSYHGNTLGALAVGGNQWRRRPFEDLLIDVDHIDTCYAYRDQRINESLEDYGLRVANQLDERIKAIGAENIIGFIAEPVVGATAGVLVPAPGYFKRIRQICDDHGILLILDEVMCGMGRTGTVFACDQENISPDILTIAKGLAGGYQPLGAMLCSAGIHSVFSSGSGVFQHGHTYIGHATACAAGLAVQQVIEEEGLLQNVNAMGEKLHQRLVERFDDHPYVGDIRGRGLFRAIELVSNRATKAPIDPSAKIHAAIKRNAMDLGLVCYPNGGTINGVEGDHVLLAPPYLINAQQIDEIVSKLGDAVDRSLKNHSLECR
jgi:adenosylmethionine-8-amino-7-oxononanoate aminotransferase